MTQHTVKAYGDELDQLTAEVARMGGQAEAQINDAVASVVRRDVALARQVIERDAKLDAMHHEIDRAVAVWNTDDEVDEHYNSLFRELLTYMMGDPRTIGACTHLLFMAKNLERIGDHATNIAENVLFLVTGEEALPPREKRDATTPD